LSERERRLVEPARTKSCAKVLMSRAVAAKKPADALINLLQGGCDLGTRQISVSSIDQLGIPKGQPFHPHGARKSRCQYRRGRPLNAAPKYQPPSERQAQPSRRREAGRRAPNSPNPHIAICLLRGIVSRSSCTDRLATVVIVQSRMSLQTLVTQ
jgi:hypothetical protein